MISGKGLHCDIGANAIDGCYNVSFRETGGELDATDGSTGGYGDTEVGVKEGEISGRAFYRTTQGAWTPVTVGTICTNLKIYVTTGTTDPAVECPLAIITQFEITAEVRGRIEFTFTAKTKGAYTINEVPGTP